MLHNQNRFLPVCLYHSMTGSRTQKKKRKKIMLVKLSRALSNKCIIILGIQVLQPFLLQPLIQKKKLGCYVQQIKLGATIW